MSLKNERDVIAALAGRSVTVAELYTACREAGIDLRDDGLAPIVGHGSDQKYKRRVRSALQAMRKAGRAERVADGTWVIEPYREAPRRAVLVMCGGDPSRMELVLAEAAQLLGELDEPADLILADPPWGLLRNEADRERIERAYVRNTASVVPGYVDVPASEYGEFTERWVTAGAGALRPGGYLSIITGPSAAAHVQVAAEKAGLNFVNQIVASRPFALRTTRRFAHAHTVVTILCAGPVTSRRRFFAAPPGLPKARSGAEYPLDFWPTMTKPEERQGLLKYDNSLPPLLVRWVIQALTRGPENGHADWTSLVVDPFMGGGTGARIAFEQRRRYIGGDVNPHALRYVMARFADELSPSLF